MKMPVLFVGHGTPMNAIRPNAFRSKWESLGRHLPRPSSILCISAHWETRGTYVTASDSPETIHDFYGFPKALFDVRYPAPGDPALAARVAALVTSERVRLDPGRGLDHGSWAVLIAMYPRADIPVVQLSIDTSRPGAEHVALARQLAPLRDEGVLIVGSGNIGAANVTRTAGKGLGVLTLLLDAAKGFVPVWLAGRHGGRTRTGILEAIASGRAPLVVARIADRHEVDLDVGPAHPGGTAQEGAGLGELADGGREAHRHQRTVAGCEGRALADPVRGAVLAEQHPRGDGRQHDHHHKQSGIDGFVIFTYN